MSLNFGLYILIFSDNSSDLQMLFTGGADGKVIVWNKDLKVIKEINVNNQKKSY